VLQEARRDTNITWGYGLLRFESRPACINIKTNYKGIPSWGSAMDRYISKSISPLTV